MICFYGLRLLFYLMGRSVLCFCNVFLVGSFFYFDLAVVANIVVGFYLALILYDLFGFGIG